MASFTLRQLLSFISTSLRLMMTLDIPQFYQSLTTVDAAPSFEAIRSVSDQVWRLASVLLGLIVTASFTTSAQDNAAFWFFIRFSVAEGGMSLLGSTSIIVLALSCPRCNQLSIDVATSTFLAWTFWDTISYPAICAARAIIAFTVALIASVAHPILSGNVPRNNRHNGRFAAANITLLLIMCFAALRFGLFMLHIRRLSIVLGRAAEP